MLARSRTPRWRRWSTATRMLCSEMPVSSRRLTILRTRMSLNEYSRWLPEPAALRMDGHDERGAGPVVQLAVGDAGDLACAGSAVSDEFVGDRVVREKAGLHGFAGGHRVRLRGADCQKTDPAPLDVACLPLSNPLADRTRVCDLRGRTFAKARVCRAYASRRACDCPSTGPALKVWLPKSQLGETRAACRGRRDVSVTIRLHRG